MDLEIKVMSCKGLAVFNFFQKLSMYASVSIMSDDQRVELTPDQKQEQKTSVDEEGDGNPEWNHTVFFNLRRLEPIGTVFNHLSIVFEFRHQGQLFGDKIVGEVRVPVTGLIDSVGIDVVRFVSYEVRGSDGKHNGILDFSYKVSRNYDDAAAVVVHSDSGNSDHFQQHHNHNHHIHPNQGEIIRHFHQKHDNDLEQQYFNDPERIRYPRIGFEDFGSASSALVSSGNQYYPPAPNINSHYPTHHPDVYPPRAEHQWHLVPQQGPHYQPPPPPPVVYPTPQYGDPHWGYYRPPGSNQPNGGCDGYHRW